MTISLPPKHIAYFTNGWTATYDGDGKWLLLDETPEQNIMGVGYLETMIKRHNLTRILTKGGRS